MEGNRPEKKFRAGAVSITVWKNQTEKGEYSSIQIDKSYKDKEGKWQKTGSLNTNDLPKAITGLTEAYKYLLLKEPETAIETAMP